MMLNRLVVARLYLGIALVFGGGGSPSPLPELFVEISALVALVLFHSLPDAAPGSRAKPDWPLFAGAAALVLIPLLQLMPLPPAIWHALPGRDAELASLSLIGQANSWRPISLSPYSTLASLLSLIPPLVLLSMVIRLSLVERLELIKVVAVIAIVAAILGVVQLVGDSRHWFRFYEHTHYGFATGFSANRNANADLLLIGLIASGTILAHRRRHGAYAIGAITALAIMAFLLLSVFATGSRAGVALLLVAAVCSAALLWPDEKSIGRLRVAIIAAALVGLGSVAVLVLHDNARLEKTFERFSNNSDARLNEIWPDTFYVIKANFPIGSGMGTFTPVFKASERLEVVNPSVPNRAHEDYMEFTLEAGIAAILLLVFALVATSWRAIAAILRPASVRHRDQAIFALGSLTIFWLHSLVDYPMRAMALATTAALAVGLLSHYPVHERGSRRRRSRRPATDQFLGSDDK